MTANQRTDPSQGTPMKPRTWGPLALLLVIGLSSGCAQDLGLIDRVQPGALDKKLFQGEWYLQRTVADVPYTVGYTFIGEAEELERIRWQIHEDKRVAYRSADCSW